MPAGCSRVFKQSHSSWAGISQALAIHAIRIHAFGHSSLGKKQITSANWISARSARLPGQSQSTLLCPLGRFLILEMQDEHTGSPARLSRGPLVPKGCRPECFPSSLLDAGVWKAVVSKPRSAVESHHASSNSKVSLWLRRPESSWVFLMNNNEVALSKTPAQDQDTEQNCQPTSV